MIDFPPLPLAQGQVFAVGRISWTWTGNRWIASSLSEVSEPTLPPLLTVTATTSLPAGFIGFVEVENTTAAAMTVFLPPGPVAGQEITVKDTMGNASTYPITIDGFGALIEGAATVTLTINYSWVDLMYTRGGIWVQT